VDRLRPGKKKRKKVSVKGTSYSTTSREKTRRTGKEKMGKCYRKTDSFLVTRRRQGKVQGLREKN